MTKHLKALIIEDSEDDAELLIRELRDAGYQTSVQRVETAETLHNALRAEHWDMAFCDFTMPKFSGQAALKIVREHAPDLPFIFVSGTIGEDVAVEALKSGANDYVLKSNLVRLVPAIDRELREAALRQQNRLLQADREQLLTELSVALQNVRRLSGLLCICAGCKRIRNEHNLWQPIESFILDRADVQFSHSLCPDCVKKFYDCPGPEIPPNERA